MAKGDRMTTYDRPNFHRPRLHDMSYRTNWNDDKPIEAKQNINRKNPDPLKKHMENMVEDNPWCIVCNFPHTIDFCVIAQSIEYEAAYEQEIGDHMVKMLSFGPHGMNIDYSSVGDDGP